MIIRNIKEEESRNQNCLIKTRTVLVASLCLFFVLLAFPVFSADMAPMPPRIFGRIIDSETGLPISGAHISLDNVSMGMKVSTNGSFEFVDVPRGEILLQVSHVAYQTEKREIEVYEGVPFHITITLKPKVIVSKVVEYKVEASAQPFKIDARELANPSWNDVGDALKSIPTVQIYESGGLGSSKTVSIRGSRPEHVLVKVDGITLNNGSGKAVDLAEIPLDGVYSIDVEPEVSPGAAGGTVNIITKAYQNGGLREPEFKLKTEGQKPEAYSLGLLKEWSNQDNYFSLIGRYISSKGDFDYKDERGSSRERYNNERERFAGSFSVRHYFKRDISLGFSIFGDDSDLGVPGPLYQPPTTAASLKESSLHSHLYLEKRYQDYKHHLEFSYSKRERRFLNPEKQFNPEVGEWVTHTPQDISDSGDKYAGKISSTFPLYKQDRLKINGDLESSLSFESFGSNNKLVNGNSEDRLEGEIKRSWFYSNLKSNISKELKPFVMDLSLVLRYDIYSDNVSEMSLPWSENSSEELSRKIAYKVSSHKPGWSLFIHHAETFAPPSFVSRFLVESAFAFGNPNLKPEKVDEFSAGANYSLFIKENDIFLSLSAFDRDTRDKIIWRRNWRNQYFPDNLSKAKAQGIEVAFEVRNHQNLFFERFGAALTVQDVKNHEKESNFYGNQIPFQAKYFGNISGFFRLPYKMKVNLEYRFSGRRYTQESNLDSYSTAGGGLEAYEIFNLLFWTEKQLSRRINSKISFGIDNLLDKEYELLDRMPMPGRTYRVKLELKK